MVVVNLRPETDEATEYMPFDRPQVLRGLARMAADIEELACQPMEAAEERIDREEMRVRHRRRLAEPDPQPTPLSLWAQRAALCKALGFPS
jgi:hypothetical protein